MYVTAPVATAARSRPGQTLPAWLLICAGLPIPNLCSLCRLGVVPALLKVLQASRQPLLRAAVAAAFRHLARDGTMRSQLAEAGASSCTAKTNQCDCLRGLARDRRAACMTVVSASGGVGHPSWCSLLLGMHTAESVAAVPCIPACPSHLAGAIPALSLLLQSPSCMARQAAARAVSNLVVHNGGKDAWVDGCGWMKSGMCVHSSWWSVSSSGATARHGGGKAECCLACGGWAAFIFHSCAPSHVQRPTRLRRPASEPSTRWRACWTSGR